MSGATFNNELFGWLLLAAFVGLATWLLLKSRPLEPAPMADNDTSQAGASPSLANNGQSSTDSEVGR